MKISVRFILLFLIIILCAFFRLYRLPENLLFHGELGHNYLAVKNSVLAGSLPLLGPPTSHPWLSFGPLFYWVMGIVLYFGKGDPLVASYFFAGIALISALPLYITAKRLFNTKSALISTFIYAISPLFVSATRQGRFFFFIIPLSILYYLLVWKFMKTKNERYFILLGFLFGVMLNFHFAPLYLIPSLLILFIVFKIRPPIRSILFSFLGFLVPSLPFILNDASHQFSMIRNLFVWLPYRSISITGVIPKNAPSAHSLFETFSTMEEFLRTSFVQQSGILSYSIILILGLCIVLWIKKRFGKTEETALGTTILVVHLIIGFAVLIIHQGPPLHYFLPLYPIPILLSGKWMSEVLKSSNNVRHLGYLFILLLFLTIPLNMSYYFSINWFYWPTTYFDQAHPVPYFLQQSIAKRIVVEAQGQKFHLKRVGEFDYYEGNYAQNYQYLLWLYGDEPTTDPNTPLLFTIYETPKDFPILNKNEKQFLMGNILIVESFK